MSVQKMNIALLLGDPSGIGPELMSKLLSEEITNKANIFFIRSIPLHRLGYNNLD